MPPAIKLMAIHVVACRIFVLRVVYQVNTQNGGLTCHGLGVAVRQV
ncbi:MAG: hypothetical protein IPK97_18405 [Ahniella sp.]|nr:hypothetical protein [Ahniella sp.]